MQNGEIDPNQYGIPYRYSGFVTILGKVNADLVSVLGTEYPVNRYAPMLEYTLALLKFIVIRIIMIYNSNIVKLKETNALAGFNRMLEIYSAKKT